MANVKFFKVDRDSEFWHNIIELLAQKGVIVHGKPQEADISVVLSGKFENPCILKGKKVWAYTASEWTMPGFSSYIPVVKEYYDETINLTDLTDDQIVDKLMDYYEANQS